MKLNEEDIWILYRLLNNHANELSVLMTELEIRPELRHSDDAAMEYMEILNKLEKKLLKEHMKIKK